MKTIYPSYFNSALFITDKGTKYTISSYSQPEITNNLFLKINNHIVVYSKDKKEKLFSDYNKIVEVWSKKYTRK